MVGACAPSATTTPSRSRIRRTSTSLLARYPNSTLEASGEAVGLPEGQMGNSEVGHTNLGAGRVVYQDLTRIDKSIRDGDFFRRGRRCSPPSIAAAAARTRCT